MVGGDGRLNDGVDNGGNVLFESVTDELIDGDCGLDKILEPLSRFAFVVDSGRRI